MEIMWMMYFMVIRDTYKCRCCVSICSYRINLNGKISVTIIYIKIVVHGKRGKLHLKLSKNTPYGVINPIQIGTKKHLKSINSGKFLAISTHVYTLFFAL